MKNQLRLDKLTPTYHSLGNSLDSRIGSSLPRFGAALDAARVDHPGVLDVLSSEPNDETRWQMSACGRILEMGPVCPVLGRLCIPMQTCNHPRQPSARDYCHEHQNNYVRGDVRLCLRRYRS